MKPLARLQRVSRNAQSQVQHLEARCVFGLWVPITGECLLVQFFFGFLFVRVCLCSWLVDASLLYSISASSVLVACCFRDSSLP